MRSIQERLDTKLSYMGDAHKETDFREAQRFSRTRGLDFGQDIEGKLDQGLESET